jgi:collagenase-like PrtC family protease
MIQFTVPTNWDPKLIEELTKFPVVDVYGSLDKTPIGSGRPASILPKISEATVADHVKLVHEKKMKFSYVLNAPCMGNMEYDSEFHKQILEHLQWIQNIGADGVIVTTPFLIALLKEQFPKLKIRVSTIAHVNSVNRAKFFEQLGVSEITPDVMINRDFKTLEKMRKAVKCELVLLVTDGCLYQCPFRYYHYNMMGHASQLNASFHIDFPILNCSMIKFSNPTEVVKSRWVRPEDLSHYEAIGINHFKLGGRRLPADWIIRAVTAYSSRKYEGNLIDIIEGFSFSYGSIQKK